MDLGALRAALSSYITSQPWGTHDGISDAFRRLELPYFGPDHGSKQQRVEACAEALRDEDLQTTAERMLERQALFPTTRFRIEETLWRDSAGFPTIVKRVRHQLADDLDIDRLFQDSDAFMSLLDKLWILDDPDSLTFAAIFFDQPTTGLRHDILRHVIRFRGDWTVRELFERLGAFSSTDRRFARFVEGLASSSVLPDEAEQRHFVAIANAHLVPVGAMLSEVGAKDGYPGFVFHSTGEIVRHPKNIIFASHSKPDLRFKSAVDNDVEIVSGRDEVLVYSRPLDPAGLTWALLQSWWSTESNVGPDVARGQLYTRLLGALPEDYPPQRRFFYFYHQVFAADLDALPALLPEVWYCWDPKTVRQRGRKALLGFRMDFLMLLPGSKRIVIEVDGTTHFTDDEGRPSAQVYAQTVAADRSLRLSGYDVYRFGGAELSSDARAREVVKQFFSELFGRYEVPVAAC